jgi:hypothetical protein
MRQAFALAFQSLHSTLRTLRKASVALIPHISNIASFNNTIRAYPVSEDWSFWLYRLIVRAQCPSDLTTSWIEVVPDPVDSIVVQAKLSGLCTSSQR